MPENVLVAAALLIAGLAALGLGARQLWNGRVLLGAVATGVALWCSDNGLAALPGDAGTHLALDFGIWMTVSLVLAWVGVRLVTEAIGELEPWYARDVPAAARLLCGGLVAIGFLVAALALSYT